MKKYALKKKITSMFVTAAFLISTFAPVIPIPNALADNLPIPNQTVKELSAGTFALPAELGYIKESLEVPDSVKTVVHIQDAHCNYAAQKKISDILSYLSSEYGISAVNCEGAAKDYDLSPFTGIPEKDVRDKTSDRFVRDGIISAAEYFASNNPDKISLWGVEDADLYLKNLKIYRESLSYKTEVDRSIRRIARALDELKKRIYSPELLEFDANYTKYKDGKLGFKEYLVYLMAVSGKKMIDTKSFPDVYLLSQTLEEEDKIDFKRADREKDEVVAALKKTLSRNELAELMAKVGQMKLGRISLGEFYAYLARKAKSVKLDLNTYTELKKYIIYISIYSAVDRTRVAGEVMALEDRIRESLCVNDTQKELSILSKDLALEKNMFDISLTRDDYMYYQARRADFETANFTRFIDKHAAQYKIQAVPYDSVRALDRYREKIQVFYECSLERDKAFVKNIRFTDHTRPSSIIITGGFHTENLRELFKGEKVSYISIMPKFTSPAGYVSPYLKRLSGQRTALENVIDTAIPAVLNLQVVEILSKELALKVEGQARLNQFKLAVMIQAALVRGEKFLFKVDRTAYPKENRPQEDKIVVFSAGEGGNISSMTVSSAAEPVRYAELASNTLYGLDKIGPNDFEFSLVSAKPKAPVAEAAPPVVAVPAAKGPVPAIKPFASVAPGGKVTVYPTPAAPVPAPVAKTAAIAVVTPISEDMIATASAAKPDRVALVKLVSDRFDAMTAGDNTRNASAIRSMLEAASKLDRPVANEIIMALRTSIAVKGLGEIRPLGLDVVVQVAPAGQRSGATSANRMIEDKLTRYYNGVMAKSVIGEGISDTDVKGLTDMIRQARVAMDRSEDPAKARALLLLPAYLQNITPAAMQEAAASKDERIKIQFLEQGDRPDLVTQFELGVELIEYARQPEEASQRLLDLIAAMVESDMDPRDILKSFFKNIVIKIRPIDWQTLDEQRKSWEAVAKSL